MIALAREPIEFIDLARQQQVIRTRIDAAIARVLDHGFYILGPEVAAFEANLSAFCGARHAISCANGTDALTLVLMAMGVGPGDAVFVPSFTFAATAEVVAGRGATPVFVDSLPDTYNMDPESLKQGVTRARHLGLTPRAVIPVDLFGLPADYDSIEPIAAENGLFLLCDAAQSFGASYKGRKVGGIGLATTTSFFPAKPLGCYGDGGAIFTQDDELAAILESLRVHGKGSDKYDNVRIGLNSRLDTIQAAILIEKLAIFPDEIEARNRVAARYNAALAKYAGAPAVPPGVKSVWAQYTLRVPAGRRDALAAHLKAAGVPTAIYYPKPLHLQTAYQAYPRASGGLPGTERMALEVLSLPMHPYLDEAAQDRIVAAVIEGLAGAGR
jgi:dTDP-4-amino-4,6-dideoxygalactose transaminase